MEGTKYRIGFLSHIKIGLSKSLWHGNSDTISTYDHLGLRIIKENLYSVWKIN